MVRAARGQQIAPLVLRRILIPIDVIVHDDSMHLPVVKRAARKSERSAGISRKRSYKPQCVSEMPLRRNCAAPEGKAVGR